MVLHTPSENRVKKREEETSLAEQGCYSLGLFLWCSLVLVLRVSMNPRGEVCFSVAIVHRLLVLPFSVWGEDSLFVLLLSFRFRFVRRMPFLGLLVCRAHLHHGRSPFCSKATFILLPFSFSLACSHLRPHP